MSKLFIDTANIPEIAEGLKRGIIDGITTNPSLMAKEERGGSDFFEEYINHMNKIVELCEQYKRPLVAHLPLDSNDVPPYTVLNVEVFSTDPKGMISQAHKLNKNIRHMELAIKIPIAYKGRDFLEVIRTLYNSGVKVNATCCFSEGQLELAAKAGAKYVSLFYNRLIDYNKGGIKEARVLPAGDARENALAELRHTREYLDRSKLHAEIILGSIRNGYDITDGWNNGAHIVTAGYKVISQLFQHPGTDASVNGFMDDFSKWMGK